MKRSDVEKIISELFRQNYYQYPTHYPGVVGGYRPDEADDAASNWAIQMWENRSVEEINRDDLAGLDIRDYEDFAIQELHRLQDENPINIEFKTGKENGNRFDYDYNDVEWKGRLGDIAYEYITAIGAPSEVNIDIGDDGMNIVRISAILPDNTGYDFTHEQIAEIQQMYQAD